MARLRLAVVASVRSTASLLGDRRALRSPPTINNICLELLVAI